MPDKPIKTELHTHLMGMLTADTFLKTVEDLGVKVDKAKEKPKIYIPDRKIIAYSDMDKIYERRTNLIMSAIDTQTKELNGNINDAIKVVFSLLINLSIVELAKQGVQYVEISYSNLSRILSSVISDEALKRIEPRFLLSTNRERDKKAFKESSKTLLKGLKASPLIKGFDIMGAESEITKEELDSNNTRNYLVEKIRLILNSLLTKDGSVLRIHSGETPESINNTRYILQSLKQALELLNASTNSLEYRIGHGIRFNPNDQELLRLLDLFKPIIEINPTSNLKLSNIQSYIDLKKVIDFYKELDIPIVISTDGHGIYDTTMIEEVDHILTEVLNDDPEYQKYLIASEQLVLRKRGLK